MLLAEGSRPIRQWIEVEQTCEQMAGEGPRGMVGRLEQDRCRDVVGNGMARVSGDPRVRPGYQARDTTLVLRGGRRWLQNGERPRPSLGTSVVEAGVAAEGGRVGPLER